MNNLFLISLILHVGFLAGKHPFGTVLTIEQDQDGPQLITQAGPLEDNGGPWTQARWEQAAAGPDAAAGLHGGPEHRRGADLPWGPSLPLSSRLTPGVPGLWAPCPVLRPWSRICQDLVSDSGVYRLSKHGVQGLCQQELQDQE